MTTTFTILGSGAGDATALRSNASYVLSYNERLFMFDCGSGATSSFLRSGFDPNAVEALFISHMHADHVCDLPLFIQKLHLSNRKDPLAVYMPSGGIEPLNYFLNACYLFKEKLPFSLDLCPTKAVYEYFDGRLAIYSIANSHLKGNADIIQSLQLEDRMECFSYRINADNRQILYTADIASLDDIENHLKGIDLLLVETTHIDFERLPGMVEKNRIQKVVLTHIADDKLEDIKRLASRFPDKFILAEDNLELEI